jgi:hypothetical protein
MTAVVAFLCTDGAVIAADSMMTPSVGGIAVGHHKGLKVEVIAGPQVFAYAGDHGQAARFKILADTRYIDFGLGQEPHPIDYPVTLTENLITQFARTGISTETMDVTTVLAFAHSGSPQCCVFEGPIQPRLLDSHHFYVALGIGKQSADPFLRFLVDIFCENKQPNVREAVFLATWTLDHVIETNPGGIAGPIRIAVFEPGADGTYQARTLPENDVEEQRQAIENAEAALRRWRDGMQSGQAAEDTPALPTPPAEPGNQSTY